MARKRRRETNDELVGAKADDFKSGLGRGKDPVLGDMLWEFGGYVDKEQLDDKLGNFDDNERIDDILPEERPTDNHHGFIVFAEI